MFKTSISWPVSTCVQSRTHSWWFGPTPWSPTNSSSGEVSELSQPWIFRSGPNLLLEIHLWWYGFGEKWDLKNVWQKKKTSLVRDCPTSLQGHKTVTWQSYKCWLRGTQIPTRGSMIFLILVMILWLSKGAHLSQSLFTVDSIVLCKATHYWMYFENCILFKHIVHFKKLNK